MGCEMDVGNNWGYKIKRNYLEQASGPFVASLYYVLMFLNITSYLRKKEKNDYSEN